MSDLRARVARYITRHSLLQPGQGVVVGVSGGADSVCLLHLLRELSAEWGLRLTVAHLNHGLRGADADTDAHFVAELARAWALPCAVEMVDVAALARETRLSLEEAGRQARYAFLGRVATERGAQRIAVAHHADDQAETVLMRFLRGSGAAGLRGMLPATPLATSPGGGTADRCLIRPLLATTRAEIEAYCAGNALSWRTDASNSDTRFYRNRLRHELMPILEQYNPRIRQVLARTADVMAADYEILDTLAEESLRLIRYETTAGVVAFERESWSFYRTAMQRAVIRYAIRLLRPGLRNVGLEHIDRAVEVGLYGENGDSATLVDGLALYVDHEALQIGPEDALPAPLDVGTRPRVATSVRVVAPGKLTLADGWRMEVVALTRDSLPRDWSRNEERWIAYLDADAVGAELILRPRQSGDRFQPLGLGGHSVRLKEFMIDKGVPAGERADWPLLVGANDIAWVCGYRIDERAAITPSTQRIWRVRFCR